MKLLCSPDNVVCLVKNYGQALSVGAIIFLTVVVVAIVATAFYKEF
jgi:hypothetical protein